MRLCIVMDWCRFSKLESNGVYVMYCAGKDDKNIEGD